MLMVPDGIVGTADGPGASRLSSAVLQWAKARHLSEATLGQLGVASGMTFFPDLERKSDAVFFKYREGWKARAAKEKAFVSGGGFKLSFWNLERVLAGKMECVFITEGEADACALVEAGIAADQVLSVPNGAKQKAADNPKEQRGYDYVDAALDAGLDKAKKFVWCGDGDESGHALRADMVQLLGPARFYYVDWPEGCKDANDLLIQDGPQALRDRVVNGSLEWPVDGLYNIFQLPEPAPLTLWHPGFGEWERRLLLAPRTLSVVTGHPGHGKTAIWGQIWYQVVRAYDLVACVASFETRPKPHMRRQLRTLFTGKLERDLTAEEIEQADYWISKHYVFAVHPTNQPTLKWFMDMAEVAVVRHGAKIIQLDPWNRLEAARTRDETETEYIGRCLRELHAFAHDFNCHVQILAHPSKMEGPRRGKCPTLEDISGSKNWENMVDQGFVVFRPEVFDGANRRTEAAFYHKKARFEELGYPCKFNLNYSLQHGKFQSTDYSL